jgi:hypothetical protein
MIKRVLSILLAFITLAIIGVYAHTVILENQEVAVPFSLHKLYHFHAGFSILICVNLEILDGFNKIRGQLGYLYLGALLLKIVLFSAVFYQVIINGEAESFISKISLLVPTFIFLLTEVFFVAKILNRKQ